jgi:hypothetical protein
MITRLLHEQYFAYFQDENKFNKLDIKYTKLKSKGGFVQPEQRLLTATRKRYGELGRDIHWVFYSSYNAYVNKSYIHKKKNGNFFVQSFGTALLKQL